MIKRDTLQVKIKMEQHNFFIYQWHIDEKEEEVTAIRIYGIDEENNNVCLRVNNFTPFVYLELPDNIKWNESKAQIVSNKLDTLLGDKRPIIKSLVMRKKLYGAHIDSKGNPKLFPYLFCSFSTKNDITQLGYKIRRPFPISGVGLVKLKIHEQSADPILQLTCTRNIPSAGWITFSGKRVKDEEKITLCHHEFNVRYKNLSRLERNVVAHPKIMGFDIEVNSTNPSAMPKAENPGDKVFQISCVMSREGSDEDYTKYLLSLGDPDQEVTGEDVIIQRFETESALLEGFVELIRTENPNIISGYNILGFDIPYMIERSKYNMCICSFDLQGFHKFAHAKEKTIKWSSSAYGTQEFQFLDAEGRLYIDLLPLVKRDFKMDNYKLKTISTYFLGATKDPLSVKGIFKCYRIGIKKNENEEYSPKARRAMGVVGKYCVQDSVLVVKLMNKLQTWVGLCEMAKTCNVGIFTLYTAGQQIKVYSQVYQYCMYNNITVEQDAYITGEDERYVGAHVFDPIPGVYDRVLPFDFASLYPTTIIAYNIDYSTWVTDENIPDDDCHVMEWEDHVHCIHDPKVIRKGQLTALIDKEKEKMKDLRTKRDKTNDILRKKEFKDEIDKLILGTKPYIEERSNLVKSKPKFSMCAKRYYRFLKEPKGVLPTILQNLLDARKNTRTEIKQHKKKIEELQKHSGNEEEINNLKGLINVLDKRQLSYKISANSMYGAMGVRKGYLPFMPGAMCTTYMGRVSIELVAKVIPEKFKGELVYGDTDSNYIHFPHLKTAEESWDYAEYVADEVSKLFPPPMKLEFEEVIYWRFFILTKKRYMYKSCGRDGIVDEKIGKKGVLLARRDNSMFIRKIYEQLIMKIFNREDMDSVTYFILEEINKLCSNSFNYTDFTVTKKVGSTDNMAIKPFVDEKGVGNSNKVKIGEYTAPILSTEPDKKEHQFKLKNASTPKEYYIKCLPAQVQLAERMKRRGQRVDSGSRLEYVITENGGHLGKQYDKVESSEYFALHRDVLRLDFMYYLKLFTNPGDQVLNVAYKNSPGFQKDFVLEQYKYRTKVRTKLLNELKSLFTPKLVCEE